MKRVILCEGKTDAILISYFLIKSFGWTYIKEPPIETDSIRNESEHDRDLVDKARKFIQSIPDEPYLNKTRYRPKACLGVILSVMSPDWVFSELDERLTLVKWEEIGSVEAVYEKLSEL